MSAPARRMSSPAEAPGRAPRPSAPRSPRPSTTRQTSARRPSTRRRPHHLGFALLAGVLIGSMVLGIVVLHVLLAQQSFRIDDAERRIETLGTEHLELVRTQATLSAPGRIAAWATRHGMRLPDDIRILRAPNGSADPAGAGTISGGSSATDLVGGEG
jgi:hypothetical protein